MGPQAMSGLAAMGRVWFAGPLGAQLEVGRATHTSASLLRMRVIDFGVNAIAQLPDRVTNATWVRPYLGAGMSIFRSSLVSTSGVSMVDDTARGYQAFGGAEFTFANLPQVAVSADLRHTWAETPFSGFDSGGLGLALAALVRQVAEKKSDQPPPCALQRTRTVNRAIMHRGIGVRLLP